MNGSLFDHHMALKGAELLEFIQENEGMGRISLARKAGFVRTNKKGEEVANVGAFYNALFDAQGLKLASKRGFRGSNSKSYETSVHASGILLIGKSYTEEAELQPGDVFRIKTSPGKIALELVSA
jgi:hypothetical protein